MPSLQSRTSETHCSPVANARLFHAGWMDVARWFWTVLLSSMWAASAAQAELAAAGLLPHSRCRCNPRWIHHRVLHCFAFFVLTGATGCGWLSASISLSLSLLSSLESDPQELDASLNSSLEDSSLVDSLLESVSESPESCLLSSSFSLDGMMLWCSRG